jgi:hypothetical protein
VTVEEFIAQVQPGVTLFGVLLALALVSFKAAFWMREQERDLGDDELERLKELMLTFRHQFIEPILLEQFRTVIEAAYVRAATAVCDSVHRVAAGDTYSEQIAAVVNERGVAEIVTSLQRDETLVEAFLLSKSGEEFLTQIDSRYRGLRDLVRNYQGAGSWARTTAYSLFALGLLLLCGMLQAAGAWSSLMAGLWMFMIFEFLGASVVSFIKYEIFRVRLRKQWETHEIYGQV